MDTKKEWDNMYYQNNKDKISERKMTRPKYICGCGSSTSPDQKTKHLTTQKHLKWEKLQADKWGNIEPLF